MGIEAILLNNTQIIQGNDQTRGGDDLSMCICLGLKSEIERWTNNKWYIPLSFYNIYEVFIML